MCLLSVPFPPTACGSSSAPYQPAWGDSEVNKGHVL